MSSSEVIDTIVRLEWEDFSRVLEEEGRAPCQRRPDVFARMRRAMLGTWSAELLDAHLEDVENARGAGRSPMTEKLAWMGEATGSPRFRAAAAMLPMPPYETFERIERAVKLHLVWQARAGALFPRLTSGGRPLLTEDDGGGTASFETCLRGELRTYSPRSIEVFERYALACWRDGVNLAVWELDNVARSYGFADAAEAERSRG